MMYAINNPPTKLIQSYYSCIMKIWDAFFAATGLASSNTQLYIGLGLLAYMYLLVWYQNRVYKSEIRWKSQKVIQYLIISLNKFYLKFYCVLY